MAETITNAAIRHEEQVVALPRPARHHTIIRVVFEGVPKAGLPSSGTPVVGEQGFMTSEGRFVGREEAARIAVRSGQIERPKWGEWLYSEDLW